jgi:hypothetical protein
VVNVTPEDRRQLEAIVGDRNAPQKRVCAPKSSWRRADGWGTTEIMRRSGEAKPVVWRWQERKPALPACSYWDQDALNKVCEGLSSPLGRGIPLRGKEGIRVTESELPAALVLALKFLRRDREGLAPLVGARFGREVFATGACL